VGWLRRRPTETVAGRALVVPFQALNTEGNSSNRSADSRAKTRLILELVSCEPGAPVRSGTQTLITPVPNWLRVILFYAGSNEEPAGDLPAEVQVPVRVAGDGSIVDIDLDGAAEELAPHRDVAVRWGKSDEAPLADVREIAALPGNATRGVKSLASTWRDAVAAARSDEPSAPSPEEDEQRQRTANMLKHDLTARPKRLAKVRASALEAGPMMVQNVKSGSMSSADFESWLQFQLTSGAIDEAEAQQWRAEAS
jgi:hypothetical protein